MTGSWLTGWATADVVSAAEYAKSMGSISDTTLGAGAASIDISSLPANYAHLLLVAYLRSDAAVVGADLVLRFNGDSAGNYASGGSAAATSINSATNVNGGFVIAGASATASTFSAIGILIPHYAGTANFKAATVFFGAPSTATFYFGGSFGGVWRNTAAINRVTISAPAGNIVTGSRLTIYAMGA